MNGIGFFVALHFTLKCMLVPNAYNMLPNPESSIFYVLCSGMNACARCKARLAQMLQQSQSENVTSKCWNGAAHFLSSSASCLKTGSLKLIVILTPPNWHTFRKLSIKQNYPWSCSLATYKYNLIFQSWAHMGIVTLPVYFLSSFQVSCDHLYLSTEWLANNAVTIKIPSTTHHFHT